MNSFINNPNLPQKKVSFGIIDKRVRNSIITELEKSGISVLLTEGCIDLYEAVAYHPDMFIHHLGGNNIVAAPNAPQSTVRGLIERGFNIIAGRQIISRNYPWDISYNVARIGEYAVCNVMYTDKVLISCLEDSGVKIIDVRQGYAKCSICIVDNEAIVTSDEGIYRSLSKFGFDILKIQPGSILLKGMDYGFIGGASGLISKNDIAFTGNIMLHPDYKKIEKFLCKYNKEIKALDSGKLMDAGTFIPLKEYCIEEIC